MIISVNKLNQLMKEHEIDSYKALAEKAGINYNTFKRAIQLRSFSPKVCRSIYAATGILETEYQAADRSGETFQVEVLGEVGEAVVQPAASYFHKLPDMRSECKQEILDLRKQIISQISEMNIPSAEDYHDLMILFADCEMTAVNAMKQSIEKQQAQEAHQRETLRGMAAAGLLDK